MVEVGMVEVRMVEETVVEVQKAAAAMAAVPTGTAGSTAVASLRTITCVCAPALHTHAILQQPGRC